MLLISILYSFDLFFAVLCDFLNPMKSYYALGNLVFLLYIYMADVTSLHSVILKMNIICRIMQVSLEFVLRQIHHVCVQVLPNNLFVVFMFL